MSDSMGESHPGLVSVIVVTYNHAEFVREAIESVLAQSYRDLEIIVTDDGSVDGTQEILKEYERRFPDKISLVLYRTNTGIAPNVNRGLAVAKGEYIAWLGGDDMMLPEKISKQVALLRQRPEAVGCTHDAEVFESESGKVVGLFSESYNGKSGLREGGIELWFDPAYRMLPSAMMFRSVARPAHGFDERLKMANDWLFDIELFRNGKCCVLNEVLTRYRRHGGNVGNFPGMRNKVTEEVLIVLAIVESRYPELRHLVRKRRRAMYLAEAGKSCARGEDSRSHAFARMAIEEGAFVRGIAFYVGLPLFRSFLSRQIDKRFHQQPKWFVKIYNRIIGV
jgi:glycosyltransferase involved in cell wall biosynthesis